MRKRIIALVLAACLLLTGCNGAEMLAKVRARNRGLVKFGDIAYEHVQEKELADVLEKACQTAKTSDNMDEVLDQVWEVYDLYDWIYTMYSLTEIYYSRDLTSVDWADEHDYCMDMTNSAEEALDTLYRALAVCPCREELESEYFGEGFFDRFEGESVWDETFRDYMTRETQLEGQYYTLSARFMEEEEPTADSEVVQEMQELFVEMIALRQEIADYAGYDSYPEFAYDWYFYRDYTPEQAQTLAADICEYLVPLYWETESFWDEELEDFTTAQMVDYTRRTAKNMGGAVLESFAAMESYDLYDVEYSDKKYDSSFAVYLQSYGEPFLFVNPMGTEYDALTMAHEFGHFCNDYVSYGSTTSIDVAEVFSQGMEYLSLCYGEPSDMILRMKLEDCLNCYVDQAAYSAFEHEVYDLRGEELTVDNVAALFNKICTRFGPGDGEDSQVEGWEYVDVSHFFTDPMYIISYVVSNDAAFQFYQKELETPGSGLSMYMDSLDTQAGTVDELAEEAGLESPFLAGRMEKTARVLEQFLG